MLKKCTWLCREAHSQVKMLKALHARTIFERSGVVLRCRRAGFCMWSKVAKREGFVAFPKTMAGVGHLQGDLERCILHGRRGTRDMFIRDATSGR